MPNVTCPSCQSSWSCAIAPSRCKDCNKPLPTSAVTESGGMDLMLKEQIACPKCRRQFYEEDMQDGCCPRCGKPIEEEEEEYEDEEPSRGAAPRRGARGRRGAGRGRRKAGRKKVGKKKKPAAPPQKRQVILTEEFKRDVFDAFKRADAGRAQQLCYELCGENEDHAKQIYSHLLGIAKKNNWVGIHKPGAPVEVTPVQVTPVQVTQEPSSLEPLPMPAGLLSPGGPDQPLPMPAGLLSPEGPPPQALSSSGEYGGLENSMDNVPMPLGSELLPPVPPPMPEPPSRQPAPAPAPVAATAPAPAVDAEPEERGFLGRVALEGRAAQVSLLCMAGRYAAGRDLAQSTLARDPYSPRGHAALGEALAGLGETAQALQAYTNAVRADPGDPVCVRGYAQILARMGRYQEAVNAYRRLVGPSQGSMQDAVALAEALRKAGDPAGAQRVMDEVVKRDPQSLEPIRQRAEQCVAQGDPDTAATLLEQILGKEKPPYPLAQALADSMVNRCGSSSRARVACASVFTAVGRPFGAVRLLAPVAAHNPADFAARRSLGLAYARLGAGPQAEEHLLGCVQRGVADAEVFRALGEVYLERGDTASGVKALMRARDAKPDAALVRRALARALAAQGDLEGAIRELEAAHGSASDDGALEDELDRITERAHTKRVKELEARLLANEEDCEARLQLAVALARRGDLPDAIEHLQIVSRRPKFTADALATAQKIHEEDGSLPRELAFLLLDLHESAGSADQGIEILEHYLSASPDDGSARLRMFEALAKCHRTQDAVEGLEGFLSDAPPYHLQEAVTLAQRLMNDEGARALAFPLARAQRRLGNVDGAAELYARVLEWEPELTEARVEYARMLEGAGKRAEAYEVLKVLVEGGTGSTAELERLATLALGAGRLEEAVALLQRAVDRHPEDLALRHALEATDARLRDALIRKLEGSTDLDERTRLAGLYAENGNKLESMRVLRALGKLDSDKPDLSFLQFSAEHFAAQGKEAKAEAALRQVGRTMGYPLGSEQHKELLHRIATLYERKGNRRDARRMFLEIFSQDPGYRDIVQRIEVLSDDVRELGSKAADERVLELVDVGAPLGTIFDTLQGSNLALDPQLLAEGRKSSAELRAQ